MARKNTSIDKCCRACMQVCEPQYSMKYQVLIKDEHSNEQMMDLSVIYEQCTHLLYDEMDEKWQWFCHICFDQLISFYEFRKMCIDSYNLIKRSESAVQIDEDIIYLKEENFSVYDDIITDHFDDKSNEDEMTEDINSLNEKSLHQILTTSDDANVDMKNQMNNMKVEVDKNDQMKSDETADELEGTSVMDHVDNRESDHESSDDLDFSCDDGNLDDDSISDHDDKINVQETNSKVSTTKRKKSNANMEKSNSNEVTFSCDVCSAKFFRKHRFDAHMRKHLGLKQWQCEKCEKSFQKFSSLSSHIKSKHYDESEGKPEYKCEHEGCDKVYSMKESLRNHIQKIHLGKAPGPESRKMCELCGKSFSNNNSLIRHSYSHTKVTPFKCDLCSKMFATAYKLKEHKMRHDGIKNFVCPTCGLRKTTNHELRNHMKYHTENEYPCKLCDMVFSRPCNVNRHMRVVHCGVKAYPCTHCDKSFGKAETLKHHIMTHTGEKPHACPHCGKRFIQSIALKTHMKTHNKNK